jgi:Immunity protein 63
MTEDPEELLYWLVSDLAWDMASEHELAHRRAGEDSRRQLFDKHVELLALANATWSRRKRAEYDELLLSHPFSDSQG